MDFNAFSLLDLKDQSINDFRSINDFIRIAAYMLD